MAMLEVRNISKRFGGVIAVCDFSMTVERGEIVGIIGPNGAGKTTIFNVISKVYPVEAGDVALDGVSIAKLPQEKVARAGIGRTFQNIRLFSTLSILDNVKVACDHKPRYSLVEGILSLPRKLRGEKDTRAEALECLRLVGMEAFANERPSSLPYGLQRRLEIARALAMHPKVLLLDEPAAGLNPEECMQLVDFLHDIRTRFDISLIIIEHRMDVVMNLCDRIYVQDFGRTIAVGAPDEIQANEDVLSAYLGEEHECCV